MSHQPDAEPDARRRRLSPVHVFAALGVIAVPAFGWFGQHWSGATTVVVYWFENVAMCLYVIARIAIHQRLNPKYGHFRYQGSGAGDARNATFLSGFALISLVFCAAHGVFLAAILALLTYNRAPELALIDLNWRSVGWGCLGVFAFLTIEFLTDLSTLRQWSFREIEVTANVGLGRVMVVHMTLLLGFVGIAATDAPSALFTVFVVLKTMAALSTVIPQWEPERPPRMLTNLMNRMPNVHPGESFEDFWAKDKANERQRQRRNEQPWQTASS